MFGYPFFRQQQQQSPRYYAPSQNPRKRYVRDEFGNVYLVPDNSYYPRNIDLDEYYYPQQQYHHRQQQQQPNFNSIHEEDEDEEENEGNSDDEPTQFENDNYHHHNRLVFTQHKQSQHQQQKQKKQQPQQKKKQQQQPTRIPINTNHSHSHSQQQQQPIKVTHKQEETKTKTHTLAEQTNAAVVIQKVFRGRRVRRDSPIAKLSTLRSTQKAANELFLQADNENILEEGHVFESNTSCVGNVPKALAQLDHELTKLLLVLDGVGSGLSEEVQTIVRSKRKEVAQNIELMLTAVDVAKKTCVIRPTVEQPEHPIANTNTNINTTATTTPSDDSPVDVEMQSVVDCDNIMIDEGEQSNNTPTETQTTSNILSLSSETTTSTPQTTNDTPSSDVPSHSQPFNIDPAFEDITELIDQQNENNEPNTSDSEDWVVLPSDSVDMEIAATTPSAIKPSHSTIPSLKNLSYNACDKIIKSALLRTPVAC